MNIDIIECCNQSGSFLRSLRLRFFFEFSTILASWCSTQVNLAFFLTLGDYFSFFLISSLIYSRHIHSKRSSFTWVTRADSLIWYHLVGFRFRPIVCHHLRLVLRLRYLWDDLKQISKLKCARRLSILTQIYFLLLIFQLSLSQAKSLW